MEGERLSELRNMRHLSQQDFADLMGISKNAVSKYERNINTPDDELKKKFAEFFNVSTDYLLGVTRDQAPIHATGARFLYVDNLPEAAKRELDSFLTYLKERYHL